MNEIGKEEKKEITSKSKRKTFKKKNEATLKMAFKMFPFPKLNKLFNRVKLYTDS